MARVSCLCGLVVEVVGELDLAKAEVELEGDGVVEVLVEVEGVHHPWTVHHKVMCTARLRRKKSHRSSTDLRSEPMVLSVGDRSTILRRLVMAATISGVMTTAAAKVTYV